jgi:hypothetical protein
MQIPDMQQKSKNTSIHVAKPSTLQRRSWADETDSDNDWTTFTWVSTKAPIQASVPCKNTFIHMDEPESDDNDVSLSRPRSLSTGCTPRPRMCLQLDPLSETLERESLVYPADESSDDRGDQTDDEGVWRCHAMCDLPAIPQRPPGNFEGPPGNFEGPPGKLEGPPGILLPQPMVEAANMQTRLVMAQMSSFLAQRTRVFAAQACVKDRKSVTEEGGATGSRSGRAPRKSKRR